MRAILYKVSFSILPDWILGTRGADLQVEWRLILEIKAKNTIFFRFWNNDELLLIILQTLRPLEYKVLAGYSYYSNNTVTCKRHYY